VHRTPVLFPVNTEWKVFPPRSPLSLSLRPCLSSESAPCSLLPTRFKNPGSTHRFSGRTLFPFLSSCVLTGSSPATKPRKRRSAFVPLMLIPSDRKYSFSAPSQFMLVSSLLTPPPNYSLSSRSYGGGVFIFSFPLLVPPRVPYFVSLLMSIWLFFFSAPLKLWGCAVFFHYYNPD